jgi:hypothetical protein
MNGQVVKRRIINMSDCQIQTGYWTKNGTMLQAPACTASSGDQINSESVVLFSSSEIGKQYKCEFKIQAPGIPVFSLFTPLITVIATQTFTSPTFPTPVPTGTYTLLFVVVYDSAGNIICTFTPVTGPAGSPCNIMNITFNVGSINFASVPSGAEIFIDDIDQHHVTPYLITNVPAGTHTVKLTLANYPDIIGTLIVESNKVTQVSANFTTGNVGLVIVGISIAAVLVGGLVYVLTRPTTPTGR